MSLIRIVKLGQYFTEKYSNIIYDMKDIYDQGLSDATITDIANKLRHEYLRGQDNFYKYKIMTLYQGIKEIVENNENVLLSLSITEYIKEKNLKFEFDLNYDDCVRLKKQMDEFMV